VITKKLAAIAASSALAVSVAIAGPATANNYAPGLPSAQPGVPNNPPASAPVAPAITTVPASVADNTPARVMRKEAPTRMGPAPRVRATVGSPISLVAQGLTPGDDYVVFVKRKGGDYGTLGTVVGGEFNTLPVFEVSRTGIVIVAMKNQRTGETRYIKVRVRK